MDNMIFHDKISYIFCFCTSGGCPNCVISKFSRTHFCLENLEKMLNECPQSILPELHKDIFNIQNGVVTESFLEKVKFAKQFFSWAE